MDAIDLTPKLFSDSVELMGTYIDLMRANEDQTTIPHMLSRFNERIFANDGNGISKDQLRQLGVYAVDMIYRFSAELEVRDVYTDVYFKKVVTPLMKLLHDNGVDIFYIVDNEIREDRFELAVYLYELSGAAVVVPYQGKKTVSLDEVEDSLKVHMARGRNVVYIEKDASVNYIEKVTRVATNLPYIRVFRNYAPTSKHIEIL